MVKRKKTNNDLLKTTQKAKIEQHEHHYNPVVNSGPAPLVTTVVLLLLQIRYDFSLFRLSVPLAIESLWTSSK